MEALTQYGPRSSVQAFGCTHATCRTCDETLFRRADDRCPMCRAARTTASRVTQTPAAQQQHNAARVARHAESSDTIFFAARIDTEAMDEEDQQEFMLTLQRTLFAMHSRQPGDDLAEFASGSPAQPETGQPAVRDMLHALTHGTAPLSSFHRLAARVRAARRRPPLSVQDSAPA